MDSLVRLLRLSTMLQLCTVAQCTVESAKCAQTKCAFLTLHYQHFVCINVPYNTVGVLLVDCTAYVYYGLYCLCC